MGDIIWTSYQQDHITKRHDVTATDFEEAWHDRNDIFENEHYEHGAYFESVGCTENGRILILIWRWQDDDVWPITAYSEEEK